MSDRTRKTELRAILIADLAGYSRLVSLNERETLALVENCFAVFRDTSSEFDGDVIKTMGDGILLIFASSSQALRFAVCIHDRIDALQDAKATKAKFRIGIHIGEVEISEGDVFGHAVNVAARLVALAHPGGVCVSHDVFHQTKRSTELSFAAAGLTRLKNIPEAMPIYHLQGERSANQPRADNIAVRTLDEVAVEDSSGRKADLSSGHMRALIGYLALSPSNSDYKNRLAALLWPEQDAQGARRSLGYSLRKTSMAMAVLAASPIISNQDRIGLDPEIIEVDLIRIAAEIRLGNIDEMLVGRNDWPDALLRGTERAGALFQSWLKVLRHSWRTKIADLLEACLERYEPGELEIRHAAAALLALEPSHELAVQKLIQFYAHNHNAGMAAKVYQEFVAHIREHYKASPSSETTALIEKTRGNTMRIHAKRNSGRERTRIPSIEVESINADAQVNDFHLAAGFRNELLANLSRFRQWVVQEEMPQTSTARDGERGDYRLSFSSLRLPQGHGLSLRLSDLRSERVVWGDSFTLAVDTWVETQRLMVRQIAARLEVYLSSDRLSRAIDDASSTAPDYDRWLRGEQLLTLWTPEAEDKAGELFTSVIANSPDFAPAHASLASIQNVKHLIRPGVGRDHGSRALALAERAVELDPLDARNHLIIAWSAAMSGAYDRASLHYDLALTLNPSSPKLLISAAQGMAFLGFKDRARQLLDEAIEIAPFLLPYQWCYVCSTRWMLGDYEGALIAADRGGTGTIDTPGWRAAALAKLGRSAEAERAFTNQVQAIAPFWAGSAELKGKVAFAWFTSAFPIAKDSDREMLRDALMPIIPP